MKLRRSLYARPVFVRGEQCAEAPLGRGRRDPAAAWQYSRQSRAGGYLTVEPSWLPSAACAAHSNTGRRPSGVVVPGYPDADRALVALSASTCPASARPVSGVRYLSSVRASGTCPASAPGVRASDIQCRVRVQCPVRASGIRVHFVRTGEFVERLVRQAATRLETGRPGNYLTRGSLSPDCSHGLKHLRFVTKAQALCQTVFTTS
jgi:hypothetical protein